MISFRNRPMHHRQRRADRSGRDDRFFLCIAQYFIIK